MGVYIKDNRNSNIVLQEGVLLAHPDTGVYGVVVCTDLTNYKYNVVVLDDRETTLDVFYSEGVDLEEIRDDFDVEEEDGNYDITLTIGR